MDHPLPHPLNYWSPHAPADPVDPPPPDFWSTLPPLMPRKSPVRRDGMLKLERRVYWQERGATLVTVAGAAAFVLVAVILVAAWMSMPDVPSIGG